jgi:oligosaccharide repeat unit polymerase
MLVEISFGGLALLGTIAALYGAKRYRTLLNPLTIFSVIQMGLFTILSGIVAISMQPTVNYTSADIVKTTLISVVYLGGVTLPYLFHGSLLPNLFGKGLRLLGLRSEMIAARFKPTKFALLLAGAACVFVALASVGGGGILWLTNTREAYIGYRAGAGPFFALTQWLLMFALLYYLWSCRPRRVLKVLLILLLFSFAIYFLGSKNNILTVFVIGIVYYNFMVKRISSLGFFVLALLMFLMVLGLLVIQSSYASLLVAPLYFKDYFDTSAQFISRFDEFSFQYGQGWLSSFWSYVPRGLFPYKPYEYGLVLIHQVLFPGMAAKGHTPGLLGWSLAYLDFGVVGVFITGLSSGVWQRMVYEYFLTHKQEFFAFVFMMQFSLWPVWTFMPLVFVMIWSIWQSIYLRLTWRHKRYRIQRWAINTERLDESK